MSELLRGLPHAIPFRAISAARDAGEKSIEGDYLISSADALSEGEPQSPLMLFEAMAQLGGMLAFRDAASPAYLSGIDRATIDAPLVVGDRLKLRVTLDATFGALFRFSASAEREGAPVARATFYLAAQEAGDDANPQQ